MTQVHAQKTRILFARKSAYAAIIATITSISRHPDVLLFKNKLHINPLGLSSVGKNNNMILD